MKDVVECVGCACAVLVVGCGFVRNERLVCSMRETDVDPDDGCTFGSPGDPRYGCVGWDATVGDEKRQLTGW